VHIILHTYTPTSTQIWANSENTLDTELNTQSYKFTNSKISPKITTRLRFRGERGGGLSTGPSLRLVNQLVPLVSTVSTREVPTPGCKNCELGPRSGKLAPASTGARTGKAEASDTERLIGKKSHGLCEGCAFIERDDGGNGNDSEHNDEET
jgi:hypothetical protein